MNQAVVTHTGIVKNTSDTDVEVSILSKSACSACHLNGACNLSETEEKTIKVPLSDSLFKTGEKVMVKMKQSHGFYALFLAYILPFIILFTTLSISVNYTTELHAGLLSLGVLVPYYLIIFFMKKHLQKTIAYELEKI